MDSICHTIAAVANFIILLFLFMYAYSIFGMQFFAGKLKFNEEGDVDLINGVSPRANFDTLLWAFVTVFQVLVGDGWNNVMYNCFRAVGWTSTFYFISLVVLGNFILINLLLAILIGNFEEASILMKEMEFIKNIKEQQKREQLVSQMQMPVVEKLKSPSIKMFDRTPTIRPIRRNQVGIGSMQLKAVEEEKLGSRLFGYQDDEDDDIRESIGEIEEETENGQKEQERKLNHNMSVDSSYDSSFTQIDNQEQLIQNLVDLARPSDSFDAKQFTQNFLDDRKPRASSIGDLEEEKEIKISQFQQKSIMIQDIENQQKRKNSGHLLGANLRFLSNDMGRDRKMLKIDLTQISARAKKEDILSPLQKQQTIKIMRQQSNVQSGLQSPRQVTKIRRGLTTTTGFIRNLSLYKNKGRFYQLINRLKRSSLFILYKRSWLRIQLIRFTVPIKPKFVRRTGTEGVNYRVDLEELDQVLDSDQSSDSDSEFGMDMNDEWELNDQNSKDNTARSQIGRIVRNPTVVSQTMETNRGLIDSSNLSANVRKIKTSRRLSKSKSRVVETDRSCKCRCTNQQYNRFFENAVLVLIVISSILLILDNPINDPDSIMALIVQQMDQILTFLFLIEALMKIMAYGLVYSSLKGQPAYVRVGWNILDLFVVLASLIDFSYSPTINFSSYGTKVQAKSSLKSLKALRALRALRPLRVISRNEGLKLVVNALFSSLSALFNVLLICLLFILIFSVIGINLFKGTFYSCKFEYIESSYLIQQLQNSIDTKYDCLNIGGSWLNSNSNFDNIFQSMLTLFQLINIEGWLKIAYQGVDARGIGLQPKPNNKEGWIFYFIFFIIVGNMFILNLFVGVVIVNFNRMKDKLYGYVHMSEDQRKWVELQRFIIRKQLVIKREMPSSSFRLFFYQVVNSQAFEITIMIIIVINTVAMSIRYFQMPELYSNALEMANYVFAIIFNVECLMKLIGLGKTYFSNSWNIFDFIVVFGTNLGILFKVINTDQNIATAATIVRSFRIVRIFKLIKASKNIKVLIDTLIHILPSLANVGSLIFLMLFIYAALGINLFATVMYQDEINEKVNFRSFGTALMVLLRCATGEGWNLIMMELANTQGYKSIQCIDNQSYDSMQLIGIRGCGTSFSYLYFISYIIAVQLIVMNLFIAVVVEGFSSSTKENTGIVTTEHYNQIVSAWADYDKNATGWISLQDLAFLIFSLDYPLGRRTEYEDNLKSKVEQETDSKKVKQFDYRQKYICDPYKDMIIPQSAALKLMIDLNLPVYDNNKVHFKDVCLKLTRDAIFKQSKNADFEQINDIQKSRLDRDWSKRYAGLRKHYKIQINSQQSMNSAKQWAGMFIYKTLRMMRDNMRVNRQNQYLSHAINKRKLELQKQQEHKLRMEDIDNHQENEGTTSQFENNFNRQKNHLLSPIRQETQVTTQPEKKKVKDTERSTWWQGDSNSQRMEKWLSNQEKRQRSKGTLNDSPKKFNFKKDLSPDPKEIFTLQEQKPHLLQDEQHLKGRPTADFGGKRASFMNKIALNSKEIQEESSKSSVIQNSEEGDVSLYVLSKKELSSSSSESAGSKMGKSEQESVIEAKINDFVN